MLEILRITNYAIIEKLEVEFDPALSVITGETGAGKSIVLGAFRVLIGGRATSETIRSGCSRAGIEGIFRNVSPAVGRWLEENGFAPDDPEDVAALILRRDLLVAGTSRNFINGRSASVAQLRELGMLLVDMHGQNEHSRLYAPATQLQVLDSFGSYTKEITAYQEAFTTWQTARQRFLTLATSNHDALRQKDFLEFQVNEISEAALEAGEDILLEGERRRLGNAERLAEVCASVRDLLYEGEQTETSAAMQVGAAARKLADLAAIDPEQQGLATEAEAVRFALEDLAEKVRDYEEKIVGDPQRLDVVETRLELLRGLKRKYGGSLDEVIATGIKLAAELDDIVNHDEAMEKATAELTAAETAASAAAAKLSAERRKTAKTFEKQVEAAMQELELPRAVLKIQLQEVDGLAGGEPANAEFGLTNANGTQSAKSPAGAKRIAFGATGMDFCEFMVSLNAGEALKPMRKVASGGEVSRIMLALKSVLAKRDHVPTLVFDEIDTGISGEAAARVGERLEKLSASHQVICITHLPQVAARGALHLVVEKTTAGDRTMTNMRPANGDDRVVALARMLSGASLDDESRKYAEKLLSRKS